MKTTDSKSWVRKLSVRDRITLMVILISVFPILIISVYSYAKAYVSIQSTAKEFSVQVLNSVSQSIESIVEDKNLFTASFLENPEVGALLGDMPRLSATEKKKAALLVDRLTIFQPSIAGFLQNYQFYTMEDIPLYTRNEAAAPVTLDPALLDAWKAAGAKPLWSVYPGEGGSSLILLQKVTSENGRTPCGYLLAVFSPDLIMNSLQVFQSGSYNKLVLVDSSGKTLINAPDTLTILEKATIAEIGAEQPPAVPTCYEKDMGNFTSYVEIANIHWTLVLTAPYTEMMKPIQSIFFATLFGTIVLLNLSVAVIDSIDRPMNALVESFGKAAKMNFEVELEDENHDELGILSSTYNEICQQMKDTLHQVEKEQNDKRVAEIRMLQAQINPHFLFNTLDSLRFTSIMSNVPTVSNGLAALSHILRSSILRDNSYVKLESELQNVEDYLTLQKIRSCEIINLHKEIDPAVQDASIMKLLLQPIVENSVIHGIRENVPLDITIRAAAQGSSIRIDVTDNGKGFDPSRAEQSDSGIPKSSRMSGIGLHNVKDRLYLAYKEAQSFAIESILDQGTAVHIVMPYIPWKEESNVSGTDIR